MSRHFHFSGSGLGLLLALTVTCVAAPGWAADSTPTGSTAQPSASLPGAAISHAGHHHTAPASDAAGGSAAEEGFAAWLGSSPLGFFSGWGLYMPRTHCLVNEAGQPDWPWIIALVGLTLTVVAGYLRIFHFWRKAYLAEREVDRNRKMMTLAYIFLFCAICGYAFSLLMYVWPAYRLLALFLVALNVVTWRFALNLKDFRVSLSARRLERELSEALESRNAQFASLIESLPDMVFYKDVDGVYLECNENFAQLFGRTREDMIGRTDHQLFDKETADQFRADDLWAQEAGIHRFDEWIDRPDGEKMKLHTSKRTLRRADGKVLGVACVARDITTAHHQQLALKQAKTVAESANVAKSTFLANISHEIRTPLTGVLGFAELLLEQADADLAERQEWARTIQTSARHLQTLLNDVLDISKIEAGKMEVEIRDMSLSGLLADLSSIFRPLAVGKGLNLEMHCPRPLPETICCDPTRLRQVLSNLLTNAIKFTETGSVRIEVDMLGLPSASDHAPDDASTLAGDAAPARRGVDVKPAHPQLRIDVVDTGRGLSEQQQSRLFERFSQADNSVNREHGGTGLGLTIARHFCEALGGGLRMESREGFGTRMIVTVDPGNVDPATFVNASEVIKHPSAEPRPAEAPTASVTADTASSLPAAPAVKTTAGQASGDRRVLMIDDGPTNRKFVSVVLKSAGYRIDTAEDGQRGVERALQDRGYDLILMDMQMPVLDGYAATRRLREAGCTLPIIALTASALKGDRERCLEAGCDAYLTKPIERRFLLEAIERQIAQRPAVTSTLFQSDPDVAWLVNDYVQQLDTQLQQVESALRAGSFDQITKLAHLIVGTGGTMGYAGLSDLSEQLETAARRDDAQACRDTLQQLRELQGMILHGLKNPVTATDPGDVTVTDSTGSEAAPGGNTPQA